MPSKPTKETEYRDIPGFPGYRVGDDGSVWSCWSIGPKSRPDGEGWAIRAPFINRKGYAQYSLRNGPMTQVTRYGHRLVLEAFVGPCPAGFWCRHLNGNPTDNRLDNLRWGTVSENAEDRRRHGTLLMGEGIGNSKLKPQDVLEIRRLYESGVTQDELAARYRTGQQHISRIINKKRWKHV